MRTQNRIAALVVLLAVAGVGVSVTIERLHQRLTTETGYTSFCNVSEGVNCDAVLTSAYATLFGVSLSQWALLFYGGVIALGIAFMAANDRRRRLLLAKALFVAQVWGLLLAAYLAGVAVIALRTVCLMCSALYVVSVLLVPAAWWLLASTSRSASGWRGVMRDGLVRAGMAAALVGVGGVGLMQARGSTLMTEPRDAPAVCAADPEFCRWFAAQPRFQMPASGGHSRGPEDAPITVVEFSDFACGHCRGFRDALDALQAGTGRDVRLVFRHFPLDASCNGAVESGIHPDACLAAVAAECAAEQGRFWAYHDLLFENQKELGRPFLLAYAERLRLDVPRFTACLGSDTPRARVTADTRAGAALGVESTPTLFLNGRRIAGALDRGGLANALVLARGAAESTPPSH